MSIRVVLNHKTEYRYDRLVTLSPQVIRLRPAPHCRTPILSYSLHVRPRPHFLNWQQDPYNNYLARVVFPRPVHELLVEVELVADMTALNPFDYFLEPSAERYPFRYEPILARELGPYLEAAPAGPQLLALVESVRRKDLRTNDFLVGINQHVQRTIRYLIRHEPGVQTCEETLNRRCGSCRDSAWLLVQLLRHLGLAARFVSGYLIQLVPDVKPLEGPAGPSNDFTDLHAWAEVYLPGAGWVGLDATSGLLAGEGHLPLACAADPTAASPITGAFSWATSGDEEPGEDHLLDQFRFQMSVTRIQETPRVTKPYTEEQWQAIDALGEQIDEELSDQDVRLTMGGEPTFVAIDSRDSPEWNLLALGPEKRRAAGILLRSLRDRFAPGGLLHFGQGKWYPGESLPRWSLGCYWRRDGVPIWDNPALVGDQDPAPGHTAEDAHRFGTALARRLGVEPAFCAPAYEDVWYYLWRERSLPANVDPLQNRLDDPEERSRLARLFEHGLGKVVGYALPLRPRPTTAIAKGELEQPRWESGRWLLRREHLYLIPGDSPMGLRLPLDALPWEAPEQRDQVYPLDPLAPREPLPPRPSEDRAGLLSQQNGEVSGPSRPSAPTPGVIRTTLCVEPREGRLCVFLPPVSLLEDYLELVAAVEATAAELQLPALVEGYRPPSDHRLHHFLITPDPGVLEVNIHPAHSWRELVANTTILYEEAHQARLSTEKFQLDGRHCGTGGGNHVVLGGPTPADSPILRRPDLLRSLIACWHNHPALSYLFSGLFVGPTSQAPRLDEARNDSLYEMEIAFRQIPDEGDFSPEAERRKPSGEDRTACAVPLYLVDRVFRHLLADMTGNTHRAEFCIDKLYNPDTSEGRRGLVELRAFEMPPHPRMSLVQQLLVRTLIACYWQAPYRHRLVRWGTELHDRFLLPHFVEQDLEDLLVEIDQAGYPLDKAWFAPHLEFRFPLLGSVTQRGIHLELRQAIEPWHVLGEEQGAGGAVRYVDSSVERLQVKVQGLTDTRHVVTCNGRRVPLYPTGLNGEFVAGVRYRAWQPPSCLHPTIPVHAPLVFDIFDTWTGRSVGGCQYHVAHPGGLAYEVFPVNASEAETRRQSRFVAFGPLSGSRVLSPLEPEAEFPLTLDLRQPAPATDPGEGDPSHPPPRAWPAGLTRATIRQVLGT